MSDHEFITTNVTGPADVDLRSALETAANDRGFEPPARLALHPKTLAAINEMLLAELREMARPPLILTPLRPFNRPTED